MVKLNFQIGQFLKLDFKKGGWGGAACAQVAGCPVLFYCILGEVKQMPCLEKWIVKKLAFWAPWEIVAIKFPNLKLNILMVKKGLKWH